MAEQPDLLFKTLFIGDALVGKSAFASQLLHAKFLAETHPTVGVELGAKRAESMGATAKLQIWDVTGQERFRPITTAYYRGGSGLLVFYDITKRETFEHVPVWVEQARKGTSEQVSIVLVGCKKDLQAQRAVTHAEASFGFFEASAKTGENVHEAYQDLVDRMVLCLKRPEKMT